MLKKYYKNANKLRINILKDNKDKSGIYKWINKINNKSYIGSAIDLAERLRKYFSPNFLKKTLLKSRSLISRSLLKYNYNNFDLKILEYCEPKLLIEREQYFLDLEKPEYNICKVAGSALGRIHTIESIAKIKLKLMGRKHSIETIAKLKDRKHTKESRIKIKLKLMGHKHSTESIAKMKQNSGLLTIVVNVKNGSKNEYISRQDAAKNLNLSVRTIFRYINTTKLINKYYLIYSTKK